MPVLRVQQLARAQGLSISTLSRKADIAMGTARRYWYSSSDGKVEGPPLEELNIPALQKIADLLGVQLVDLIAESEVTE